MRIRTFCLALVVGTASMNAAADPFGSLGVPGFVIRPEQRFDPYVQRLLARAELRAMPIGSSGLLYLVPVTEDASLQEMQIRYLERLIDEKGGALAPRTSEEKIEPSTESP